MYCPIRLQSLLALCFGGCASAIVPFTAPTQLQSSSISAPGQVQIAASAGGIVNDLGQGNGLTQAGAQVGLGHGLEVSLSGYNVLSRGLCGAECAGRVGLTYSNDRPEEAGYPKTSLAAQVGFGVGGGVLCVPQPPPFGPELITCSPRPAFYGGDFSLVGNLTPHHSVSPYAAVGLQVVGQNNNDGTKNGAAWLRAAGGLEITSGRLKLELEGGALAIGLKKEDFPDAGSLLTLFYVSTGLRVVIGRPPKIAPVEEPSLVSSSAPTSRAASSVQALDPASTPPTEAKIANNQDPKKDPWALPSMWGEGIPELEPASQPASLPASQPIQP